MKEKIIIKTEKLSAGYYSRIVVQEAEFELRSGEIMTLVGPNGSGKSTLLKTIAAQLAPLKGTYFCKGLPCRAFRERKLHKRWQWC